MTGRRSCLALQNSKRLIELRNALLASQLVAPQHLQSTCSYHHRGCRRRCHDNSGSKRGLGGDKPCT